LPSSANSAIIEQGRDVNVAVFDSANPHLVHYDIENDLGNFAALGSGPTGPA
jgi:hypothetical protein